MSQRLGDLLVREKIISADQLDKALKNQKETGGRLGSILVKLGYLTDEDVTNFLSRQYGVPAINLNYFEIDPVVASETSIMEAIEKAYTSAAPEPEEDLETVMSSLSDIADTDVELQAEETEVGLNELEKAAEEAPIVKLVNMILTDAVKRGA